MVLPYHIWCYHDSTCILHPSYPFERLILGYTCNTCHVYILQCICVAYWTISSYILMSSSTSHVFWVEIERRILLLFYTPCIHTYIFRILQESDILRYTFNILTYGFYPLALANFPTLAAGYSWIMVSATRRTLWRHMYINADITMATNLCYHSIHYSWPNWRKIMFDFDWDIIDWFL